MLHLHSWLHHLLTCHHLLLSHLLLLRRLLLSHHLLLLHCLLLSLLGQHLLLPHLSLLHSQLLLLLLLLHLLLLHHLLLRHHRIDLVHLNSSTAGLHLCWHSSCHGHHLSQHDWSHHHCLLIICRLHSIRHLLLLSHEHLLLLHGNHLLLLLHHHLLLVRVGSHHWLLVLLHGRHWLVLLLVSLLSHLVLLVVCLHLLQHSLLLNVLLLSLQHFNGRSISSLFGLLNLHIKLSKLPFLCSKRVFSIVVSWEVQAEIIIFFDVFFILIFLDAKKNGCSEWKENANKANTGCNKDNQFRVFANDFCSERFLLFIIIKNSSTCSAKN